jgi:chromosome segregation ATPase
MTGMINTMSAGQSSSTAESFQLMTTLVQEIALMREVVSNNTEVMEQVRDMNEALTQEIHEMRIAGTELREEVSHLKQEVSSLTRKT